MCIYTKNKKVRNNVSKNNYAKKAIKESDMNNSAKNQLSIIMQIKKLIIMQIKK